jgi:hypothetical protein
MTTYLKTIEGAFLDIGIKNAETPLTASELDDGLIELNDMLAEWDLNSIIRGIETNEDAGVDMLEPRGWQSGIRSNLAVRLAGMYDRPVTQSLAVKASNGFSTIVSSQFNQQDFEFPDTLPTGSGNCNTAWNDDEFFGTNTRRNF